MFSFSYALVLVLYLSDLKAGSTNTHSEGALKPDKPKQRFPAFTSTQLLVAKLLGFLLSISPCPSISSEILIVCFRSQFEAIPQLLTEHFHALVFGFCRVSVNTIISQ